MIQRVAGDVSAKEILTALGVRARGVLGRRRRSAVVEWGETRCVALRDNVIAHALPILDDLHRGVRCRCGSQTLKKVTILRSFAR